MRKGLMVLGLAAAVGCAGAGIPAMPEATDEIRTAQQMIDAAVQAGADSLAIVQLSQARTALSEAQQSVRDNRAWAALRAQQAASAASYARALATKARADRAKADAMTALQQIPPEGSR